VTARAGPLAADVVARAAELVAELAREFSDDAAAAQAESLRVRALKLAQEDSAAYTAATLRLIDRAGRDFELGRALDRAAAAPVRIAETAADVAELAAALVDHVVPEAQPDLAGAALLRGGRRARRGAPGRGEPRRLAGRRAAPPRSRCCRRGGRRRTELHVAGEAVVGELEAAVEG
jgi:hypothetical protein